MSLIGPTPTIASVSALVRTSTDPELTEILDEVIQFTNESILTNLAANTRTREKLVAFLTPEKLRDQFQHFKSSCDPEFVALSWLADEVESLREPILDLITAEPLSKACLTVFMRLLPKDKLNMTAITDKIYTACLSWLQYSGIRDSRDQHWQNLATLFVKSSAHSHRDLVLKLANENIKAKDAEGQNLAFAIIKTLVDEFPELLDHVWSLSDPHLGEDFFSMLSVLSNQRDNRDKISKLFGEQIREAADGNSVSAAVTEAKILAGTTSLTGDVRKASDRLDSISSKLFEKKIDERTIEGFACSGLLSSVRNRVADQSLGDNSVIEQLVALLKRSPGVTAYAILAILLELARFPIKPTQEDQQKTKLRIKSFGRSVMDAEDGKDLSDENRKLAARKLSGKICDQILATSVVSWIALNATKFSYAAHEQLALLLRELTSHQDGQRRERLANQGAAVTAMYLWVLSKPKPLNAHMKSVAAASISKILATVEPSIALTGKVAKTVVIPPLVEQISNEHSDRPNLETFEALRALTNLSSEDDTPLRTNLALKAWPKIPDAFNSEFLQIRRSSLELVCNLVTVPAGAEPLLQGNAESKGLLSILGSSIIVDDAESRLAAAGALAILSEWETAAELIGHNRECVDGFSKALGMFPNDDPLLLRVLMALSTIIKTTTAELDDEVVEQIVYNEGAVNLEMLVDTLDPVEHNEVSKLVLQCIKWIAIYKRKTPAK